MYRSAKGRGDSDWRAQGKAFKLHAQGSEALPKTSTAQMDKKDVAAAITDLRHATTATVESVLAKILQRDPTEAQKNELAKGIMDRHLEIAFRLSPNDVASDIAMDLAMLDEEGFGRKSARLEGVIPGEYRKKVARALRDAITTFPKDIEPSRQDSMIALATKLEA